MKLERLVVKIHGKQVNIEMSSNRVLIFSTKGLSASELCYLSAMTFLHLAAKIKGLPLTYDYLANKSFALYSEVLSGEYAGFKTIEEMSMDEFNEFMKQSDGRAEWRVWIRNPKGEIGIWEKSGERLSL